MGNDTRVDFASKSPSAAGVTRLPSDLGSLGFQGWNQTFASLLERLGAHPALAAYRLRRDAFLRAQCDPSLSVHGFPLVFAQEDFDTLASAGRRLEQAQRRLLRDLLRERGEDATMALLAVPRAYRPLLAFDRLLDETPYIARFDILPTEDGSFRFCELNVDSSIAGPEFVRLGGIFLESLSGESDGSLSADVCRDPYRDIADHIRRLRARRAMRVAAAEPLERLVVLDWSGVQSRPILSNHLLTALSAELPDLKVEFATDETYLAPSAPDDPLDRPGRRATWRDPKHLIYRLLLAEDLQHDPQALAKLAQRREDMIDGYECELLSSKIWFSLFHDPAFAHAWTSEEREAIRRFVPHTFVIDDSTIQNALDRRDELVFKAPLSFAGRDVHIGREYDRGDLTALLVGARSGGWVAQEAVPAVPIPCLVGPEERPAVHAVVLGLFAVGERCSGLFVRSHPAGGVVNMARGASCGWALVLDAARWARLRRHLGSLC